jgi:hypothetical protein
MDHRLRIIVDSTCSSYCTQRSEESNEDNALTDKQSLSPRAESCRRVQQEQIIRCW